MKSARSLFKKSGISIFIVLIVIGVAKEFVLIPAMGKVWGWTLMTTPEGFVSNANVLETLIKSPWIVLVGFGLLLVYALAAMWETSSAILGIAYAYRGENIKMLDLFRISWDRVVKAARPGNWMILVYAAVVLPLANLYQSSDMIGAFVMPEYIEDYIYAHFWLLNLYVVLIVFVALLALKWLYLLPSFVIKNKGFREAERESMLLTKKGCIRNGIKLIFYQIIENIRLIIVPFLMVMTVIIICLYKTYDMTDSVELMTEIGFSWGFGIAALLVGKLVFISVMCYLVFSYVNKLELFGEDAEFELPKLTRHSKQRTTVVFTEVWLGMLIALLVAAVYVPSVYIAQEDETFVDDVFGSTIILAHKGYSSKAPENTMPAFKLADKSKHTDFIELDVWTAKDGVPVVLHNQTVEAATGLTGDISEYTSEELHNIPAPYDYDPESFPNAYIPTLEEVLAKYADSTPILIEIKGYKEDSELPAKIVALMDKYDCKYTCMIHSLDYQALRAVKEIDPNIRCGLIMAFVSGECYDLPYADFFSVEHTLVTKGMVKQLHLRKKEIYVWTVNSSDTAESMRALGVDGVITDYPNDMLNTTNDIRELISIFVDENLDNLGDAPESTYEDGEF